MVPPRDADADPLLVEELHDQVGDALRVVARYRDRSYEMSYLREDLDSLYTDTDLDAIFDDFVLQGLHKDRLDDLFRAGTLECSMFQFEDALVFHFTPGGSEGLAVSIDPGTGVDIESLVATCRSYL